MKKKVFLLVGLFLLIGLGVMGCGGAKSEVSVVPGQPTGLSIRGTVYSIVSGRVTGKVQNAQIFLSGVANAVATTDAEGVYVFNNVSAGSYTVVATKEGYQAITKSANFAAGSSNNMTLTVDINLIDNPALLSVVVEKTTSPETVVLNFTEPMDKTTVITSLSYDGAVTYGVVESVATWSADSRTLWISPKSVYLSGSKYSLTLAGPNGKSTSMLDVKGNAFDPYGNLSSDFYDDSYFYYYIYYPDEDPIVINLNTAGADAAPTAAPSGLKALTLSGTTEIDYSAVAYYSNSLCLSWNNVSGAKAYKVYCSYNGGPYQLYGKPTANAIVLTPDSVDSVLADFTRVGYSYPSDAGDGVIRWPFIGSGIDFKVEAVNSGGAGPDSAIINVKDNVKPKVSSAYFSSGSTEVRVNVSEPLEKSSAENVANYAIAGQTITKAQSYPDYYSGSNSYVKLTLSPGGASGTVEVSSAVQDLSGNGMDPAYNKKSF